MYLLIILDKTVGWRLSFKINEQITYKQKIPNEMYNLNV